MATVGERLRTAWVSLQHCEDEANNITRKKPNRSVFAREIGIKASSLSELETNPRGRPSSKTLLALRDRGINPDYVMRGKGPMFVGKAAERFGGMGRGEHSPGDGVANVALIHHVQGGVPRVISPEEDEVLGLWRHLKLPEQKADMLAHLRKAVADTLRAAEAMREVDLPRYVEEARKALRTAPGEPGE